MSAAISGVIWICNSRATACSILACVSMSSQRMTSFASLGSIPLRSRKYFSSPANLSIATSLRIFKVGRIEIVRPGGRKPALHPVHNVVHRIGVERRVGLDGMTLGAVLERQVIG